MLSDRQNLQLRAILDASDDLIIVKNGEGYWIEANKRTLETFKIDASNYKGKLDHQLGEIYCYYAPFVNIFIEMDKKIWETGKQIEIEEEIIVDEITYFFKLIGIPIYDRFGNPDIMMIIGRDVTEKRRTDMLLLKNEEKYNSFFTKNPDGIYFLDINGHFLDVNEIAEKLIGYSHEQLLKMDFFSTIDKSDNEKIRSAFESVKSGKTESREVRLIRKDGERIELYLTLIPTSLNENVIGITGIAQDITSKKQSEFLRQTQTDILELIAVGKPLPEILKKIVEVIEGKTDDVCCSVMFYDEEKNVLRIGYAPHLNEVLRRKFSEIPVRLNTNSHSHTVHIKELDIAQNITTNEVWENYHQEAMKYGIQSCWSLPILSTNDSLLGIFILYYNNVRKPTKFEIELLTSLSYLTGLAIERNKFEENIQYLASHDVLTNLANLRYFKEIATNAIEEVKRENGKLYIMFMDLNEFKSINDNFGHAYGDSILKATAERIKECVSSSDIASRVGGDEFVILLRNIGDYDKVNDIAQKILEAVKQPIIIDNSEFHITTSIGVSTYPNHGETIEGLMRNADTAMYNVKSTGGNASLIYDEKMADPAFEYFALQGEFRKALIQNQFILHYQPKVNIETGEVIGVEALIRWNHPTKGLISPAIFIPLAEESGFIMDLGAWVIEETCRQIRAWKEAGPFNIRVAVNVSVRQFIQQDVVTLVKETLKKEGLPPNCLEIEITESVFVKHENIIQDAIANLQDIGIRVSIDDFGTGYASLSYLKQFRANTIKIDRSFIRSLPEMKDDAAIVSAVITLARKLNMDVVAEGVETKEQAEFLLGKGCSDVQGFYYSKPLPAEEVPKFLEKEWKVIT
ncbi:EAL domain-containing protein [Metabacillus fastidiosus]|uniref:bifunctional diguanylate cyclase/phosphodiesterase n=1 Tax=Metabacillus fastidiosus TaxID=1458 RepID=UPI002E1ABF12|nr:EAL domain-containing protein [Metabacillus fastidiosus]